MSSDSADSLPHPLLNGLVESYSGSVLTGYPPGIHVGTPGLVLPLILTLRDHRVRHADQAGLEPQSFTSMVAGLHTAPALIHHDGSSASITVHLTLSGVHQLLDLPARALVGSVVPAAEVLGASIDGLREQLEQVDSWTERFAMIDDYLIRRLPRRPEGGIATAAWQLIQAGQGLVRVSTVADELGCSRRTLHSALHREAGMGPKTLSRIARFTSARTLVHERLIRQQRTPTLADVAAECGYYDESHLIRDWTAFTGTTPADWRSRDELAFFEVHGGDR